MVLATAGAFAWDGVHLLSSKDELTAQAAAAQDAITARDAAALSSAVSQLQEAAQTFASATDGPHWWIAAHLPWVGAQARPLMEAGRAVDQVAEGALAPLASMGSLDALEAPGFTDGRIDPDVLEPYRAPLAQAAETLGTQVDALASVSLDGTVTQVREPFLQLRGQLTTIEGTIQGAHVAAEVLPGMLGGKGARHYVVMVQNNAEPRTTGGIPGAFIELTVDDGRVTMGRYSSASAMADQDGVGGLTDDEVRIFTRRMEVYPQDANFTPEFPSTAELITRFWANTYGETPDAVLSVDPVALGWMLEGAPATTVGPFDITGENLAAVMLKDSYLQFPEPADQDAFFARASAELFGRIVSGEGTAIGGVERAIDAGRFMVWSDDEGEQALLGTTAIAGEFLERADAMGIFINDGSGSKIGYYIDTATTVTDRVCTDGTLVGETVEITFTHGFDGNVADLPWYVSGGGVYVPEGEFQANVLLYPAAGTGVTEFTQDGTVAMLSPETHGGRTLATARIVLEPGQSTTLTYQLGTTESGLVPPSVVETPGPKASAYTRGGDVVVDGC
ncbi:DUF4012 domain-containing protein [Demequina soli]|uniref:DUF4012 domain-containing protein n=1 Tax=Demequina soli TaxID=1638987 RepID=UPI0007843422|nr:DUF4012 domain-containing protein [Demequina soli]